MRDQNVNLGHKILAAILGGFLLLMFVLMFVQMLFPQRKGCSYETRTPRSIANSDDKLSPHWARHVTINNYAYKSAIYFWYDSLVIADSCHFITSINVHTGEINWKIDVNSTPLDLSIANLDNLVYISREGRIDALDLTTGRLVWNIHPKELSREQYAIEINTDNRVYLYVGGGAKGIWELEPKSGKVRDKLSTSSNAFLVSSNVIYEYEPFSRHLQAIEMSSKHIFWNTDLSRYNYLSTVDLRPIVHGDYLLLRFGTRLHQLAILDRNTGSIAWDSGQDYIVSNTVVQDNIVYALNQGGTLIGFDLSTKMKCG
jgi:outer membrane protein assembly factor BamB